MAREVCNSNLGDEHFFLSLAFIHHWRLRSMRRKEKRNSSGALYSTKRYIISSQLPAWLIQGAFIYTDDGNEN